ncbi:MAG: hypothetical protein ACPL6C_03955, partial [bacterium]
MRKSCILILLALTFELSAQAASTTLPAELYQKYLQKLEEAKPAEEKYKSPTIYELDTMAIKKEEFRISVPETLVPPKEEEPFFNEYVIVASETVQVIKKPAPKV